MRQHGTICKQILINQYLQLHECFKALLQMLKTIPVSIKNKMFMHELYCICMYICTHPYIAFLYLYALYLYLYTLYLYVYTPYNFTPKNEGLAIQ